MTEKWRFAMKTLDSNFPMSITYVQRLFRKLPILLISGH